MTSDSEADQQLDSPTQYDRAHTVDVTESPTAPARRSAIPRIVGWCLLVLAGTAIGWGANFWRQQVAVDRCLAELQGHWQLIEKNGEDRTLTHYYLTISADTLQTRHFDAAGKLISETHWILIPETAGEFLRLRIVNPAADRYEPQYFWHVRKDILTQIRGVLAEDPVRERQILSYQRVSEVPAATSR